MTDTFSLDVPLQGNFDDVIGTVTEALKAEGFGVLTRIDVDTVLKIKIDVDYRPYTILGACNPVLAHKALIARTDIGLMLPCNVTVEKSGEDECLVRFIDPAKMMSFATLGDNADLVAIGAEAAERIGRAAASLS
ncbi:hypothetical protein A9Q96_13100 [Rhodobacterales bacterium 52_120_T64]|nr:hypothetical protein A9Q96_13100 [Rhodobacterales bacterium 52_120_T64]